MSLLFVGHRKGVRPRAIAPKPLRYAELTLVLDGTLEYFDGKTPLTLESGDVLFLRKGSLRSRKEGVVPSDYVSFNFNLDREFDLPPLIRGGVSGEIRAVLTAVDRMAEKRHLQYAGEQISHLLMAILFSLEDGLQAERVHPLVHKITRYLHNHMGEKISLRSVAEHCYFSPVYCDSVFKRETGFAVVEYLLKLRIDEAKLLLMQGQFPIAAVGEMVGFSDANYFSRAFRKHTGVSPSAFRKNAGLSPSDFRRFFNE